MHKQLCDVGFLQLACCMYRTLGFSDTPKHLNALEAVLSVTMHVACDTNLHVRKSNEMGLLHVSTSPPSGQYSPPLHIMALMNQGQPLDTQGQLCNCIIHLSQGCVCFNADGGSP